MASLLAQLPDTRGRPLCTRYACAYFDVCPGEFALAACANSGNLVWALGVLPDGDFEIVGTWWMYVADGASWQMVYDELQARGVMEVDQILVKGMLPDPAWTAPLAVLCAGIEMDNVGMAARTIRARSRRQAGERTSERSARLGSEIVASLGDSLRRGLRRRKELVSSETLVLAAMALLAQAEKRFRKSPLYGTCVPLMQSNSRERRCHLAAAGETA